MRKRKAGQRWGEEIKNEREGGKQGWERSEWLEVLKVEKVCVFQC